MPPAGSSGSGSTDQSMCTPNALPSPSAAVSSAARCAALMTTLWNPARTRASICHTMSGLPPARSNGFGNVSVSGRMRSPRPAARIIAVGMPRSERVADHGRAIGERVEQHQQRRQLAIASARRTQVPHDERHVVYVAGLAVAMAQAREDAEHLDVPLHAHPLEVAPELAEVGIHRKARGACALPVAD